MRKMFNKINETGTMLVEAMAMLGLIAMVTPILYKKAAERTTELQDINASNQLRILANAMDAYIKDNFSRIAAGEEVVNNCNDDNVDYGNPVDSSSDSGSGVTSQTDTYTFDVSHLCEYLPYGFLDSNGKTQDSKLFASSESDSNSFQVILKKTTASEVGGEDEDDKVIAQTITGFVTAVPHDGEEFPSTRVARIATMVGSNGGYKMANYEDEDGNVVSGKIMGAQGIWSLDGDDELDMNLAENTFVISSLQPISSQGLANEDVLHRKYEPQNDNLLNSMETDLFMSYNDKNHNIRQVNQIIMMPDTEWMVGAENNSTDMRPEENIKIPFNDDNSLSNLDYSLYIGNKGGAFLEGNLAAVSSLFTVKEENDSGDGGIKYYETKTTTDSTDPNNTVTTTTKGGSVFSVTSSKLEYGNIDRETAGVLLTVDKENKSMNFAYKKTNTPGEDGTTSTTSQNLIAAQGSNDQNLSVNLLNGALSVRNNDVNSDKTYENNSTEKWKSETPAVVIGGGNAYTGSYTSYKYDTNGTPKNPSDTNNSEGSDTNNSNGSGTNNSEGRHALTVNGPAFVKDSLRTPHLKTYNVDAAKLRAGVAWNSFNTATKDEDFYLIAEKSDDDKGRLLVGKVTPSTDTSTGDTSTGDTSTQYRLQIAEKGDNDIMAGISMYHEEGISLRSGTDVSLVEEENNNGTLEDPASGQIKIGAEKAVSLSTIDESGAFHDNGVVSIQDDMLRAYNNGEDGYGYIDSVTDKMRILSRDARDQHDKLYSRGNKSLVALGDMDFSISAISESDDKIVPVVDIKAAREEGLISSRFAGGFAIYDYDVTGKEDYPDNPAFVVDKDGKITGGSIGNPSLYVGKGDFQILTTKDGLNKGDIVLHVDNNDTYDAISTTAENGTPEVTDDRGSVYIRRGAINIASANGSRLANKAIAENYASETDPVGYIAANRFISHVVPETGALDKTNTKYGNGVTHYDRYEVNPAYTSVMHDIKLTTRGGARLSDILPDFINKGIYVVNNTFKEYTPWQTSTVKEIEEGMYEITNENTAFKTATSPYLGFVPTPICPPNYSKVITVNPSGWSMAEAGTPYDDQTMGRIDIVPHTNPYLYWNLPDGTPRTDVENAEPVQPLTFQKSTWLRAMVVPYCGQFDLNNSCKDDSGEFTGWGVIMGFLYPESYYRDFLSKVGKSDNINGEAFGSGNVDEGSDTVYWNIYPVYYRQLEGYATVYCYFNREGFNVDMADTTYDQLNNPRE